MISSVPLLLAESLEYGKADAEFVYLVNNQIDKFNVFFMEQEEDFIIQHNVSLNEGFFLSIYYNEPVGNLAGLFYYSLWVSETVTRKLDPCFDQQKKKRSHFSTTN